MTQIARKGILLIYVDDWQTSSVFIDNTSASAKGLLVFEFSGGGFQICKNNFGRKFPRASNYLTVNNYDLQGG